MGKTDDAIDRLTARVENMESASDSAVTFIQGVGQMIRDAADDPAALDALATRLDAKAQSIGDAIAANTT